MFGSTATFQSVPFWHGLKRVSNLYLMNGDGTGVRQVCFDQDQDFHSTVLPNGQVLYNRWDYTGINHIYLRELMLMNPDGTGQRAIYGSGSWYPLDYMILLTDIFYAKRFQQTERSGFTPQIDFRQ